MEGINLVTSAVGGTIAVMRLVASSMVACTAGVNCGNVNLVIALAELLGGASSSLQAEKVKTKPSRMNNV
jgi:hypothetical protein